MVSCNLCSNVSPCSNATWQSFHFLQGDIYYQKNSNQNKNKAKHYAQDFFFKEKKQVFHKKTSKKIIQQKNQQTKEPAKEKKKKQVFQKKTSKKRYSTKKPANKKKILKISKLKKNLINKKTFKFF
jgi:uncharacterized protein YdaU (DUF1376 family)